MRKTFLLVVAALAVTAVVGATAGARPTATPGVTANSILLEGTYPLSGPASGYAPIPVGMGAYFSYVNNKGGVNGRKINWKYEDDGYNPANTVQITHKFVEQDHAFALVGGLGTEPQLAVRQYLNDNKVPQLFVATGATTFDRDFAQYPWTIGWQPDYEAEGAIYGKYVVANMPNAKIGVLYQNDDYGHDYLRGFKAGLRSHQSQIVTAQPYDLSATTPPAVQMAKIKASGADTLVLFATPTPTIQAYVIGTKLGYKPANVITNSRLGDRPVPDDRGEERLEHRRGDDQRRLPPRPVEPDLQQAAGHEAVPHDHGEVRAEGECQRPVEPLRRRQGVERRAGAEGGRQEPHPRRADGAGTQDELLDREEEREPVRASGRASRSRTTTSSTRSRRSRSSST